MSATDATAGLPLIKKLDALILTVLSVEDTVIVGPDVLPVLIVRSVTLSMVSIVVTVSLDNYCSSSSLNY